ncbi:GAF domain-containing protein [Myxococcus fulvus]|uniref:GAF domain-containing protein n=1 Tax=Myxococcus fulvus TaxID=33 RepID=UPI0020BE3165|nr:GAF domain-containing protein [Myxococcus fulvus]MCK8501869.1 GAF domain-containing protein [Myxococcus fulvus]
MATSAFSALMNVSQLLLEKGFEPGNVTSALGQVGAALDVDRVYIFENSTAPDGKLLCSQRYEWTAASASAQQDNPELQNVPYDEVMPSWVEPLSSGRVLKGAPRDFPSPVRELLESQDIRSLLVCPIVLGGEWWGFVGFDDCRTERTWPGEESHVLQALSNALAGSLRHARLRNTLNSVQTQLRGIIERCASTAS